MKEELADLPIYFTKGELTWLLADKYIARKHKFFHQMIKNVLEAQSEHLVYKPQQ